MTFSQLGRQLNDVGYRLSGLARGAVRGAGLKTP